MDPHKEPYRSLKGAPRWGPEQNFDVGGLQALRVHVPIWVVVNIRVPFGVP